MERKSHRKKASQKEKVTEGKESQKERVTKRKSRGKSSKESTLVVEECHFLWQAPSECLFCVAGEVLFGDIWAPLFVAGAILLNCPTLFFEGSLARNVFLIDGRITKCRVFQYHMRLQFRTDKLGERAGAR